jgi:hypothetical protein
MSKINVKKISLFLLMVSFLQANCQDLAKKLQDKTWYANGDILSSEKVLLQSARPATFMPEVKFLKDNNFQLKTDTVSDFAFVCLYQFKKNMVKIYYTERIEPQKGPVTEKEIAHYYKISPLQNSNFELIPIKEKF